MEDILPVAQAILNKKPDEVWDSNLRLSDVGSNKKGSYSFNHLTNQGPGPWGLVTNLTIKLGSTVNLLDKGRIKII